MNKIVFLGVVGAILIVACASSLTPGSRPAGGPPRAPIATYTVPYCENMTSGERMTGPEGTYFLAQEGPTGAALYEIDPSGRGVKVLNHWVDGQGDNFFAFVRGSHGWHFVIPQNRTLPGVRFVYPAGTYTPGRDASRLIKVIAGNPMGRCPMVPQ